MSSHARHINIIASVLHIDKFVMILRFRRFFGVCIFAYVSVCIYYCASCHICLCVFKGMCVISDTRIRIIREMWNTTNIFMLHTYCPGHFSHFTSKGVFVIHWLNHYRCFGIVFINDASWFTWCYFIICIYCVLPWRGQELTSINMMYIYLFSNLLDIVFIRDRIACIIVRLDLRYLCYLTIHAW